MKRMTKKKLLFIIIAVIVVIIGGVFFMSQNKKDLSVETNLEKVEESEEEIGTVEVEKLKNDFKIISPESNNIITGEKKISFLGVSDKNLNVQLNGEEISSDENGNFILEKELQIGNNEFSFSSENKTVIYNIKREEKIINSVSPSEKLEVEENMQVEISAKLHSGLNAYAEVNGEKVELKQVESEEYISARGTTYAKYAGTYTIPKVNENKSIGKITVHGFEKGKEQVIIGAEIFVKKAENKMQAVKIKNERALVYDSNTISVTPNVNKFNVPKDAVDFITSKIVVDNRKYYNLQSGIRVKEEDCENVDNVDKSLNKISNIRIYQDNDKTILKMKTNNKTVVNGYLQGVQYKDEENQDYTIDSYDCSLIVFDLNDADDNIDFEKNELFKEAEFKDNKLYLKCSKEFIGCNIYYDNDDLIYEFRNKKTTLKDMKIVIDPGHGLIEDNKLDTGALGYFLNENEMNYYLAEKLKAKLEKEGAEVVFLDTKTNSYPLKTRGYEACSNDADLYISIHNNAGAYGNNNATETYYYTPYSKAFAENVNKNIVNCYKEKLFKNEDGNFDRGDKYNDFTVTLEKTNPSILIEAGYIENPKYFSKIINYSAQNNIVDAIVDGIDEAVKK